MLKLSDDTKLIYEKDGIHKEMRIYFPDLNLTYTNERIVDGTFKMTESIQSGDNLDFVGCIATSFSVELAEVTQNIVGQKIEVYIKAENTEEIPLFKGVVDSAQKQTYKNHKLITAYDLLYSLSLVDISTWYNNHPKTTIASLFDDLVLYLDLDVGEVSWVNGKFPVYCSDSQVAESLSALDLIKSICQINGVFGRINRQGLFETFTFNATNPDSFNVQHHEEVWHEDYETHLIESVMIRESGNDGGVEYTKLPYDESYEPNRYIIQGNMFATDWNSGETMSAAENIFNLVSNVSFIPFEGDTYGLPFLECGDQVIFEDVDLSDLSSTKKQFYILSRTLSGVNGMRDNFSAEAEERYSEFSSKVDTNISSIKSQMGEYNLLALKYTNARPISVTEREERFCYIEYTTKVSSPFFLGEVLLTVTPTKIEQTSTMSINGSNATVVQNIDSPVEISVRYVLNDEEMIFYPKETYTAGKHILNLLFYMNALEDVGVFEAFITARGGTAYIEAGDVRVALMGQGKSTVASEWNGRIEMIESIPLLPFAPINMNVLRDEFSVITRDVMNVKVSDTVSLIPFIDMEISKPSESVGFNPVITHYMFNTSKKDTYEYDEKYVLADESYKFNTEYIFNGAVQDIDSGKLEILDINTTQFSNIESLEVEVQ